MPGARLLERGYNKTRLLRELAENKHSQTELAAQYGVTDQAIYFFYQRNHVEIETIKQNLEDEYHHLWIAQKEARLAEYQQDVDDLNEELEKVPHPEDPDRYTFRPGVDPLANMRVKHNALKASAEEMGQLPSRFNVSVAQNTVQYNIEGVDMDKLK